MPCRIVELRLLPPFGIARLGSSPDPMDNYDLDISDPVGYRRIVPAPTLVIDPRTGAVSGRNPPFAVHFRDTDGLIRPVCPFFEVWARFQGSENLEPLTVTMLRDAGATPTDVRWQVHVANHKAFRRTGDPNDRVEARTEGFSDHTSRPLLGKCRNFFPGAAIPFGHARYLKPTRGFPEIRLRFTPATGKVYGPPNTPPDPNLAAVVYDPKKGKWKGFVEPSDGLGAAETTSPSDIFAGHFDRSIWVGRGYLDDECDGIVNVSLGRISAYARVAAGPPAFAPDSLPVRTVADEIEQALLGPSLDAPATGDDLTGVRDIVHRALDTVRLMNTRELNGLGNGMASMDTNYNRAPEPIFDPILTDSLAVQARHERVLLAMESGTLVWFASVLREYDQVGDLSDEGRHRMPAMMRGADSFHLALTRRQVARVRAAAELVLRRTRGGEPGGTDGKEH